MPGALTPTSIAVVGLGSWGLSVLERIVETARRRTTARGRLRVHVIEPQQPGAGIFGSGEPDYLILNTPCGQHCLHPFPEQLDAARSTRGFFEWIQATGYRWVGDACVPGPEGRPVSPDDFVPRRLMGEYLTWFYHQVVADAPSWLEIVLHATSVIDIVSVDDCRERLRLADGTAIDVDHVVLTTGHTPETASRGPAERRALAPYPVQRHLDALDGDLTVAIEGMGLVALDVMTALTVGRGGRFEPSGDGLRYRATGAEPSLVLFSRSGYPYCAKSLGAIDPTGEYRMSICTPEAIAALQPVGADGRRHRIDARTELLPLVFAEMEIRYYAHAAQIDAGPAAAAAVQDCLAGAWYGGRFPAAVAGFARRYGTFDAASHFFVGEGLEYLDAKDYQEHVYATVEGDLAEALVPGGASPVKAAYDVVRALRDSLRSVVEFGGLTAASYADFGANLRNKLARMVAGPPALRAQQLLALLDAGIVRMPFGPAPEVTPVGESAVEIRSSRLLRPYAERADVLIRGHLDNPTVHRSASPMLHGLYQRGRVQQLHLEGRPVGSIELTEDFHPVNARGEIEHRLWVFGALAEGVRYFTAYIPSPKSRVRAFVDAQLCVDRMVGTGDER